MKSAKEFLEERRFGQFYAGLPNSNPLPEITEKDMIEFAKMHVQEALRIASDGDLNCSCDSWESCRNQFPKDDILNCYPLENIK